MPSHSYLRPRETMQQFHNHHIIIIVTVFFYLCYHNHISAFQSLQRKSYTNNIQVNKRRSFNVLQNTQITTTKPYHRLSNSDFSFLEENQPPDYHGEQRPTRGMLDNHTHQNHVLTSRNSRFEQWGVQHVNDSQHLNTNRHVSSSSYDLSKSSQQQQQQPKFPNTIESVANEAFYAISSTLYQKNALDPAIISNAMANSILDKRPAGFAYWPPGRDVGRLGIEIDGARFLISPFLSTKIEYHNSSRHHILLEGRGLRNIAFELARKLSVKPWDTLEGDIVKTGGDHVDNDDYRVEKVQQRPIAIYVNTIHQALLASRELRYLKERLKNIDPSLSHGDIRIFCLGQDDIPIDMIEPSYINHDKKKDENNDTSTKKRRKYGSLRAITEGKVDPQRGIILIVQPTDYNIESLPPTTSTGMLQHLQRLLARASIHQIPVVVLSPRLNHEQRHNTGVGVSSNTNSGTHQLSKNSNNMNHLNGFEQSGYQKSSTYGGIEPPRGATPWLLRDFIPPIFSWVGCACHLPYNNYDEDGNFDEDYPNNDYRIHSIHSNKRFNNKYKSSYFSRIAMTQTIMESNHPWQIFAVEEKQQQEQQLLNKHDDLKNDSNATQKECKYRYMASTMKASGRPTKEILQEIFSYWKY